MNYRRDYCESNLTPARMDEISHASESMVAQMKVEGFGDTAFTIVSAVTSHSKLSKDTKKNNKPQIYLRLSELRQIGSVLQERAISSIWIDL